MLWRQRENPIVDGRAVDRGCRILCPISIQRLSIVVHVRRYFDKNYYYFSFFFFFSSPTRVSGPFLIRDYAGHGRLRILIFCALVLLLRRIFFPPPSVNTFSYLKSCPDHRHRGGVVIAGEFRLAFRLRIFTDYSQTFVFSRRGRISIIFWRFSSNVRRLEVLIGFMQITLV